MNKQYSNTVFKYAFNKTNQTIQDTTLEQAQLIISAMIINSSHSLSIYTSSLDTFEHLSILQAIDEFTTTPAKPNVTLITPPQIPNNKSSLITTLNDNSTNPNVNIRIIPVRPKINYFLLIADDHMFRIDRSTAFLPSLSNFNNKKITNTLTKYFNKILIPNSTLINKQPLT